jgi:hypothetical protein
MKTRHILLLVTSLVTAAAAATGLHAASRPEEAALREARKALEKHRGMLERERAALGLGTTKTSTREHRIEVSAEMMKGRLTLAGMSGDVIVEGTDESAIVIVGEIEEFIEPPEPSEPPDMSDEPGQEKVRMSREGLRSLLSTGGSDNSGLGLEIKTEGNNITIVSVRPHEESDYTFRVPRSMALSLSSVIRGDVVIRGMQGEIEATVTEGDVVFEEISGPVVVQAVNGDVVARFATFASKAPSSINSVNGTVGIALPTGAAVTLDLRTINGDILTDLPVQVTERKIMPHGGPRTLRGTLNGGGAELRVNCVNDDILLRGAGPAPAAAPAPAPAPAPTPVPAPPKSGK